MQSATLNLTVGTGGQAYIWANANSQVCAQIGDGVLPTRQC